MSLQTLEEFLARAMERRFPTSSYVKESGWDSLYFRYGPRYILGRKYDPVLDFSNIAVEEDKRGQGIFTELVGKLRKKHPELHMTVSNTHQRFGAYLLKIGFVGFGAVGYEGFSDSYFLEAVSGISESNRKRGSYG